MSPEAKRSFEAEWAVLSRRLRLLLGRKRVPAAQHDDLVQETALRLLSMWDSVDLRRSLWPLTVTIALNLLRDRGRVVTRDDLVAEVPELESSYDVETVGIARLELQRVRRAMEELSPTYRSALMREIGSSASTDGPEGAAEKMVRMRARRKLKLALEHVSGLVALRVRRFADLIESMFVIREGGVTAASCVICLVLGVGSTLVTPTALTPRASARVAPEGAEIWLTLPGDGSPAAADAAGTSAVTDALRERRFAADLSSRDSATRRIGKRDRDGRSPSDPAASEAVALPSEDVPTISPPSVPVPSGDDAPSLPSPGEGDQPPSVPVPAPPPPPRIPTPPLPPAAETLEDAADLL